MSSTACPLIDQQRSSQVGKRGARSRPGRNMVPTTAYVRTKLSGGSIYGPLEGAKVDAAAAAPAFHWSLAFPARARSKSARSWSRQPTCKRMRIPQTCTGLSASFAPALEIYHSLMLPVWVENGHSLGCS